MCVRKFFEFVFSEIAPPIKHYWGTDCFFNTVFSLITTLFLQTSYVCLLKLFRCKSPAEVIECPLVYQSWKVGLPSQWNSQIVLCRPFGWWDLFYKLQMTEAEWAGPCNFSLYLVDWNISLDEMFFFGVFIGICLILNLPWQICLSKYGDSKNPVLRFCFLLKF